MEDDVTRADDDDRPSDVKNPFEPEEDRQGGSRPPIPVIGIPGPARDAPAEPLGELLT